MATSNKGKPMPKGEIPGGIKKWLQWIMLLGAGVIAIVRIASVMQWSHQEQSPTADVSLQRQVPQETRQLWMPPYGDSVRISPPIGDTTFKGTDFISRCIYTDGSEKEFPCPRGAIAWVYVHNTSGHRNSVTY